jgi:bifunctional non-homologous end joining protein LigD
MKIVVTNPDKIVYHKLNLSKQDIVNYYIKIYNYIKPFLNSRNLVMKRFTKGVNEVNFYQRNSGKSFPKSMSHDKGIKINNLDDLIYSLNLYSIEQYVGLNKLNSTRPDRMIIDLDPPKNNPNLCIKVAKEVKKLLDKIGIQGYPMTTGSKGLHIIIPIVLS